MTDAELSRDLALALGYAPESVRVNGEACFVYGCWLDMGPRWRILHYNAPGVVLPLIDWLMRKHGALPMHAPSTGRFGFACQKIAIPVWADTLAEAVARAVIAMKGGG